MKNRQQLSVQQELVLWSTFNSKISDLRLRSFANHLCMDIEVSTGATTFKMADYAKRLGVSHHSVWNYIQELKATGEWDVVTKAGVPTTCSPRFWNEALGLGEAATSAA